MAEIRPFKGLRFAQDLTGSLDQVITPPYDVLSPSDQERLHNQSQYNIIRLEYGKSKPGDDEAENQYSRAAKTLADWVEEGALVVEDSRSFYLYEQSFTHHGTDFQRRGIFAALKIEPYDKRIILPHELTMAAPKADRLKLLETTRTNTSPIFTLFPDLEGIAPALLAKETKDKELYRINEESGQIHRIWKIEDKNFQDKLIKYLKPQPVLIADGHHRYETALQYKSLLSTNEEVNSGADYIMAVLISMQEPGLLLLPTHRLLNNLDLKSYEKLMEFCQDKFELVRFNDHFRVNESDFNKELAFFNNKYKGFAIVTAEFAAFLKPRNLIPETVFPVELLHNLILKPFSEYVEKEKSAANFKISYPHDLKSIDEAIAFSKTDSVAFILDTIPVDLVYERALSGKVMPQKTTFFYPKLPSGLILRSLDLD